MEGESSVFLCHTMCKPFWNARCEQCVSQIIVKHLTTCFSECTDQKVISKEGKCIWRVWSGEGKSVRWGSTLCVFIINGKGQGLKCISPFLGMFQILSLIFLLLFLDHLWKQRYSNLISCICCMNIATFKTMISFLYNFHYTHWLKITTICITD